jgi:hypothetical protein
MAMATTCTEVEWEQSVLTDRSGQFYQYEHCVIVSDENNEKKSRSTKEMIYGCVVAALFIIVVAGCLVVLFEVYSSGESVNAVVAPAIPDFANEHPVFLRRTYNLFIVIPK